ncbi:MMPL family transporter [Amycolatopsis methanolica]|uniref:MMPL family transporter n=1 Tax=Amycolatopsis methanolica TaxID=1814 RepID=UPI003446AE8E
MLELADPDLPLLLRGAHHRPLGFTPAGTLETSIPILMFCVAYGLSMDYEVFVTSRIREEYLRTGDTNGSVAAGVQRSAPLVTTAAAILALSSRPTRPAAWCT